MKKFLVKYANKYHKYSATWKTIIYSETKEEALAKFRENSHYSDHMVVGIMECECVEELK